MTSGRLAGDGASSATHVPVLMYHSVSARASAEFAPYAIEPSRFREHLAAIKAHGYRPITMSRHADNMRAGRLEERSVVISFDDAFVDFHDTVVPMLAEHAFVATVYVPTAYVGRTSSWLAPEGEAERPVMSWDEIAAVGAAGVEVGSHSRTHAQLDLLGDDALGAELRDSRASIEDHVQGPVTTFAYPFGHSSGRVRAAVAAAGYTNACGVRDLASGGESVYNISRWTVRSSTTPEELVDLLAVGNTPMTRMKSGARATVSRALRLTGLKRRPTSPVVDS